MRHVYILVIIATLLACSEERLDVEPDAGPIVVAVLPDQAKDRLVSQHTLLLNYLERTTSLEFELVIPRDYADLLDQFDSGRVDLAWFGGLTYIQAVQRSQAMPLAFRDVDVEFTSCYLASAADTRTAVDEFENAEFSFGPSLSTSGHLMPRYFLEEEGRYPEQWFSSVRHSAGHDQTANWVSDGTVALGVANCIIVQSLFDNALLSSDDVKIIETTPPYSDYVWAVKSSMDENTRALLLDAFLSLDATVSDHRVILRAQGANGYLPAGRGNFDLIQTAAGRAGLVAIESDN